MPKRTGYLASVAMPLISMSLMVPHAQAMPNMPQLERAHGASDIIRVQDAVSPPPAGGESEEELKKRRPPAAAEEAQPAPDAKPEPANEPKPEPQPEPKPEPEPEPAATPEPRASQAPAEPAQPVEPKTPEAKPAGEAPAEARPAAEEKPAPEAAPEPAPRAEKPKRPAAEEPVAPAVAEPAPGTRPAAEKPAPEKPAPEKPVRAPETQSRTAPVGEPEPGTKLAPIEKPRPRPADVQKPEPAAGEAPAPAARPATPVSGEAPAPEARPAAPAEAPAAAATDAPPPAPGQPPADGDRPVPQAEGGAGAPAVASPTTPEQIERARKIAEDPAASNQPIVLPVENGAAVLDSAKEAPAGRSGGPHDGQNRDGQARDGQRRDGGPRGGQPQMATPDAPPPPPRSDADAQAGPAGRAAPPVRMEAITSERGERMRDRPRYDVPGGVEERATGGPRDDGRIIINFDNRTIVRHDDSRRFYDSGYSPEYERLPGGRTREIIERDNGVQIVTIRDRYGDVVQRSRIGKDGREYVLFYAPEQREDRGPDYEWRDPADDLPPMRLTVPVSQYIIDTSSDPDRDYYKFLEQPPVERVERVYSLDEVRYSARIRDKVRRIDLDTITFATGSADIPMNQARSLRKVADAINAVLKKDPSETFLIEGHTDAVGSDESNLVLSDQRAEQVAVVLSDVYGIPPENMTTQGYGERYLKVNTAGASQENRRVTIRRITALVKPVAQNR